MNWGYKITGLYISFVLMILTLVTMSMKQEVDLVTPDYYQQELEFQDKINKMNRADALDNSITWEVITGSIEINFPEEQADANGTIYLYRPSDVRLDKKFPIAPDENGIQIISTENIQQGLYKLEIDWTSQGESYFKESLINI